MTDSQSMPKPPFVNDLSGMKFGELEVISFHSLVPYGKNGHTFKKWNCRCSCGNVKALSYSSFATHRQTTCGECRFRMSDCRYEDFLRNKILDSVRVKENGCWEDIKKPKPYANLTIRDGSRVGIHRLSYQLFVGDILDGMYICHHCDNPCCFYPLHLFPGTNLDNAKDMLRKDRNVKREKVGNSKLKECDVWTIRDLVSIFGFNFTDTALIFNVSRHEIANIIKGKTWKSLIDRESFPVTNCIVANMFEKDIETKMSTINKTTLRMGCFCGCGRPSRYRGLASGCHSRLAASIKRGETTWEQAEQDGLCGPAKVTPYRNLKKND